MLWNGAVSVSVVVSAKGELLIAPSIAQSGLIDEERVDDFLATAALRIEDKMQDMTKKASSDDNIRQLVTAQVRSVAKSMVKRRPNVEVHIMRASQAELLS